MILMKHIADDEIQSAPDDLRSFYLRVLVQNMGYPVCISATEAMNIRKKYPEYFEETKELDKYKNYADRDWIS